MATKARIAVIAGAAAAAAAAVVSTARRCARRLQTPPDRAKRDDGGGATTVGTTTPTDRAATAGGGTGDGANPPTEHAPGSHILRADPAHAPGHRHRKLPAMVRRQAVPRRIRSRPFAKHQHGLRHPGKG